VSRCCEAEVRDWLRWRIDGEEQTAVLVETVKLCRTCSQPTEMKVLNR
jgi:hypothetical protein